MGPLSTLFGNPAVKILESRLWQTATMRYLGEHPSDVSDDAKTIARKVRTEYEGTVAAKLRAADRNVRAQWRRFKHVMVNELRTALVTVFRMSDLEWYSIEVGRLPNPDVIAIPCELLKHVTADVLFQFLRKDINFESLDDETLSALATYAAEQGLLDVLEDACRKYEPFQIGEQATDFLVSEIIKGDAYFLGEEKHHSLIDMVILCNSGAVESNGKKSHGKRVVQKWYHEYRTNRSNDRRFTGDEWEIGLEELKCWASKA